MKFDETITIIGKNHVFRVQPEFTEDDFFVWHFTLLCNGRSSTCRYPFE